MCIRDSSTIDNICDSIHYKLHLYHHPEPIMESLTEYLCPEESILYNGKEISEPGSYFQYSQFHGETCDSIIEELIVEDAILPNVYLVSDTTITIRTEYELPLYIDGEYTSVLWTPDTYLDCDDCENPTTKLPDNQEYTVYIKSIDGCNIKKDINIKVENYNVFYVANIISKSKGNNSLYVQTRPEIKYMYDMYIYDRYGNLIHECTDAYCNESSSGWTPQNLNPGVFSYLIRFKDEYYKETISGSVTIIE